LLAYAAVGIAIPLVFSRRASQPGQEIRQKLGQISSFMLDSIMGLAESLQFGQGPKRQSELAAIDQGLTKSRSRLAALTSLQQLLTNLTILLSAAGMLALAKS
ncbi:hypothetical protein, partial [Lactobacillus nasalidis]